MTDASPKVGGSRSELPSYGVDTIDERREPGSSAWPTIIGSISVVFAIIGLCGGIAGFTGAAFGPVLLGVGSERPPAPPLEIRWHAALEAIFTFSLSVMLMCSAFGVIRRQRRAALMLGLWTVCAIVVRAIFLAWGVTLWDEMMEYRAELQVAHQHALQSVLGDSNTWGNYESIISFSLLMTRVTMTVPFIYPALVGLWMLRSSVRREIASWK